MGACDTLLLSRREIERLLSPTQLLAELRKAFVAYSLERTVDALRVPVPLPAGEVPQGASGMLIAPGLVPGIPAYCVKVHAKYPGQDPAIRGLLVLHDLADGHPLAVMESGYLTALRTGLAGALGAEALALPTASHAAIVGAGAQGRSQLDAMRMVRHITDLSVFDRSPAAAAALAEASRAQGLRARVAASLEDAVSGADVVVTATWATQPFLLLRHARPGLHITTVGPDQPGKCELAAELLRASKVVVDDRKLAVAMGAVGGAGLGAEAIHAELGEILGKARSGRTDDREVTVFGSVGLPFQDLAAAWLVYRAAVACGAGRAWTAFD